MEGDDVVVIGQELGQLQRNLWRRPVSMAERAGKDEACLAGSSDDDGLGLGHGSEMSGECVQPKRGRMQKQFEHQLFFCRDSGVSRQLLRLVKQSRAEGNIYTKGQTGV